MSAEIVILAEYRDRKASVTYSCDPLAAWFAWAGFWWGVQTK